MKRKALSLVFPAMAVACLALAGIKTNYDPTVDFTQYKTYSWIGPQGADSPWPERIARDVDAQLAAKGWTKIQSGGDMVVSAFGRTRDVQTLESYYTDFGSDWKWHGFGTETREVNKIPMGTLVVDVFDGRSKKLIWTSSSTETLSAKPNKTKLEQSVAYMFRHFPAAQK